MYNPISPGGHWRPVLTRQRRGVREVALSFDDGPTPETTPPILRMLKEAGVRATFFLSGTRVERHPALVADIVRAGHDVYGHAWDHINLDRRAASSAVIQMRRVEQALQAFRPTPDVYLVRFPYNAGWRRAAVHRAMRQFHSDIRFAYHTVSTEDYRLAEGCPDRATLDARCGRRAETIGGRPDFPGSILLLHESPFDVNDPLNPEVAEVLLPHMLAAVKARGLRCGPIVPSEPSGGLSRFLFLAPLLHR